MCKKEAQKEFVNDQNLYKYTPFPIQYFTE